MRKELSLAMAAVLTAALGGVGACSSGGGGGGSTSTGGSHTTSSGNTSSSSGNSSSGTTTGASSSGTTTGSSSGTTTGTGGPCFGGNGGYTALTAAPTPHQIANACASGDITAFINACVGSSATNTTCNNWQDTNVAGNMDGGGAGTACGNCIFPADSSGNATNTGPTFTVTIGSGINAQSFFGPNYGGCVELKDTTNGAACALAMDNINDCLSVACELDSSGNQCDQTDYNTCVTFVTGSGQECNAANTAQSACATDDADGGATMICSPSGGNNQTQDLTYIINLFCGTG